MDVVWTPPESLRTDGVTARFMVEHDIADREVLLQRSIDDPAWFWDAVVRFLEIPFQRPYTRVFDDSAGMAATTWFDDGAINVSEVCVDKWAARTPDRVAIIAETEDGGRTSITFAELLDRTNKAAGMLRGLGVGKGDAVAAFLPMGLEAIVILLATARLGAIYVPIFSGFNAAAVATRLEDSRAKVMACANGFRRRGNPVGMKAVADEAAAATPTLETVLVFEHDPSIETPWTVNRDRWWHDEIDAHQPVEEAVETNAEDPLLLGYTSGTTGRPKGVVHVHGGLTVKILQEGAFQFDLTEDDTLMWLTDMGWIMGPWMVMAGLGNGASIVAFDGAPDFPSPSRLWEVVAAHAVTVFGVSPTLVRALKAAGDQHVTDHDFSNLRAFGSTGEPWNPDPWMWLFETVGESTRPIINISGGTEIGACFLSADMLQGIKPTALGAASLGLACDVFDEDGRPLRGEVGELVCTKPWPGMARGIWGDQQRFLDTYFGRWPDVWVHGDWASIDEDGFWFLHGRSDDTLNIAGKRIGPAEIESVAVAEEGIVMAAAVGVPDELKGEAIIVYCVPDGPGAADQELADRVSDAVVTEFGKAFRPKRVVVVADLPRTRSAKIVRRAVRAKAIDGDLGDLSSLENPESLDLIVPL